MLFIYLFFIVTGKRGGKAKWSYKYRDLGQPKSVVPGPGCSELD